MTVNDHATPEPRDKGNKLHGPYWVTPDRYGEAEALNSMGTVAAPLLAGFSLAAMVQTLTITTRQARWPDAALLLFMLAAVFFVATVQLMFWARGYQASPPDLEAWWPDARQSQRMKMLQSEQRWHAAGFRMWSHRARIAYDAAVLCLLAALTLLAVPTESHRQVPVLRWLAVAVGGVAFIIEAIWVTGSFVHTRWVARLLEPPPEDASSTSPSDLL